MTIGSPLNDGRIAMLDTPTSGKRFYLLDTADDSFSFTSVTWTGDFRSGAIAGGGNGLIEGLSTFAAGTVLHCVVGEAGTARTKASTHPAPNPVTSTSTSTVSPILWVEYV